MLKDQYPWSEMLKPNAGVTTTKGRHCDPDFDIDAAMEQAQADSLDVDLIEEITMDILGAIGCSHCGEKPDRKAIIAGQAKLLNYLNAVQERRGL
jgi:hypothetical protein